jgi:hypothetical protein
MSPVNPNGVGGTLSMPLIVQLIYYLIHGKKSKQVVQVRPVWLVERPGRCISHLLGLWDYLPTNHRQGYQVCVIVHPDTQSITKTVIIRKRKKLMHSQNEYGVVCWLSAVRSSGSKRSVTNRASNRLTMIERMKIPALTYPGHI